MATYLQQLWAALSSGIILSRLGYWTYLLIALLVAVEGSATTLVAASLAGAGVLNPGLVFLAAGTGNATADVAWYWLGRLGQFDTLAARLPYLHGFERQIVHLEQKVKVNGPRLYLITKLFMWPAVIPTLITAGMVRVPWRKILLVSVVTEPIYTGSLVLAGFFLGDYLNQLQSGLKWLWWGGVVMALLVLPSLLKSFAE